MTERLHWSFEVAAAVEGDSETRLAAFRCIHDEIREKVDIFVDARREPSRGTP